MVEGSRDDNAGSGILVSRAATEVAIASLFCQTKQPKIFLLQEKQ